MGIVYEAVQLPLDRRVALKVLPRGFLGDPKAVKRFVREAKVAARLKHPNIVSVYDMGVDRGSPYFAMELISGETLGQILKRLRSDESAPSTASCLECTSSISALFHPLEGPEDTEAHDGPGTPAAAPEEAAPPSVPVPSAPDEGPDAARMDLAYCLSLTKMFAEVADGLHFAHDQGIIHRDIKPSNLMLDTKGRLRILDFGLARSEEYDTLTISKDMVGTLLYMSPEQVRGARGSVDRRSDVYALGATFYEMLALRPPCGGGDYHDVMARILREEPKSLRRVNVTVPRDLDTIVLKCLEKESRDRYQTAKDLADDLRRFLRYQPIRARQPTVLGRTSKWCRRHPTGMTAAAAVFLLSLAASCWWYFRPTEVTFVSELQGLSISVDGGKEEAITDRPLRLASGRHTFRVSKDGFFTREYHEELPRGPYPFPVVLNKISVDPEIIEIGKEFSLRSQVDGDCRDFRIWLERPDRLWRSEAVDWHRPRNGPLQVRFSLLEGPIAPGEDLDLWTNVDGLPSVLRKGIHVSGGPPRFTTPYYVVGRTATHLVALDFDGDGNADLAVACRGEVRLIPGNGDGTFRDSRRIDGGYDALRLAVIGKEALSEAAKIPAAGQGIVAVTERDVRLVASTPGEIVSRIIARPFNDPQGEARCVAIGDFDGDRSLDDVVVCSDRDKTVSVLWKLGTLNQISFPHNREGPFELAVADFDADGTHDLVIVSRVSRTVDFYLSRPQEQTFVHAAEMRPGNLPHAVAAGNLYEPQCSDEFPDVVIAQGEDEVRPLYVRLSQEDKDKLEIIKLPRAASVGAEPRDLLLVDLGGPSCPDPSSPGTRRGRPDLVVANWESGDVSIVITPEVDLGDAVTIPVEGKPRALAAADFNGDGLTDIAVLGDQRDDAAITLLLGEPPEGEGGGETFSSLYTPCCSRPVPRVGAAGLAAGRLDGDAWPDFAVPGRESDQIAVILSNGGQYSHVEFFPTGADGAHWVRIADVDGDGHPDLVVSSRISREISILYSDGAALPRFSAVETIPLQPVVGSFTRPRTHAVDDFDGDGDQDIVVPISGEGCLVFLWNLTKQPDGIRRMPDALAATGDSRVAFSAQLVPGIGPDPRWVEGADLDGDGRNEVLAACQSGKLPGQSKEGYFYILWNEGLDPGGQGCTFAEQRLRAWGSVWKQDQYRSADDFGEFIVAASFFKAPLRQLLVANRNTIAYYGGRDQDRQYDERAQWIPIDFVTEPTANGDRMRPNEDCDPEFALGFDIDGDGWDDVISIDEEMGYVCVLLNRGEENEPEANTGISTRFERPRRFSAQSPQGVQAFRHEGTVYLATVHRASDSMTIHTWDQDRKEFRLWNAVNLQRPWEEPDLESSPLRGRRAMAGRDCLAIGKGLLAFARDEGVGVSLCSLRHVAGNPLGLWHPDHGTLTLRTGYPITVALRESGPKAQGPLDLAIGAVESLTSPEDPRLSLYATRRERLPAEGDIEEIELDARVALLQGTQWIAVRCFDLGSEAGDCDDRTDVLAATDRGIWMSFGQGNGKWAQPASVVDVREDEVIRDVACADLDGDAALDIVLLAADGAIANVSVMFGPFGRGAPLPRRVRLPETLGATCCGAGRMRLHDASEAGMIVIAKGNGSIRFVRCDGDRTFSPPSGDAELQSPAVEITFGDLNRDKLTDVIVACRDPGMFLLLLGSGDGQFGRQEWYLAGRNVETIRVADIGGDGWEDDVVVAHDGGIYVGENRRSADRSGEGGCRDQAPR